MDTDLFACRLCSNDRDLLDVGNDNTLFAAEYRNLVRVMTGITIHRNDRLLSMICRMCLKRAIDNYDYRRNARIRNQELQRKCGRSEANGNASTSQSQEAFANITVKQDSDDDEVQFVSISMDMTTGGHCDTPPVKFDKETSPSSAARTAVVPGPSTSNITSEVASACKEIEYDKAALDANKSPKTTETNVESNQETSVGSKKRLLSPAIKVKQSLDAKKSPKNTEIQVTNTTNQEATDNPKNRAVSSTRKVRRSLLANNSLITTEKPLKGTVANKEDQEKSPGATGSTMNKALSSATRDKSNLDANKSPNTTEKQANSTGTSKEDKNLGTLVCSKNKRSPTLKDKTSLDINKSRKTRVKPVNATETSNIDQEKSSGTSVCLKNNRTSTTIKDKTYLDANKSLKSTVKSVKGTGTMNEDQVRSAGPTVGPKSRTSFTPKEKKSQPTDNPKNRTSFTSKGKKSLDSNKSLNTTEKHIKGTGTTKDQEKSPGSTDGPNSRTSSSTPKDRRSVDANKSLNTEKHVKSTRTIKANQETKVGAKVNPKKRTLSPSIKEDKRTSAKHLKNIKPVTEENKSQGADDNEEQIETNHDKRAAACAADDKITLCKIDEMFGTPSTSDSESNEINADIKSKTVVITNIDTEQIIGPSLLLVAQSADEQPLAKVSQNVRKPVQKKTVEKTDNFQSPITELLSKHEQILPKKQTKATEVDKKCDNTKISKNTPKSLICTEFDNVKFSESINLSNFTNVTVKLTHTAVKNHIVKLNRRFRRRQKGKPTKHKELKYNLQRLDIPDVMPTTSKEQKELLTSSLGLQRTGPPSPVKAITDLGVSPQKPVLPDVSAPTIVDCSTPAKKIKITEHFNPTRETSTPIITEHRDSQAVSTEFAKNAEDNRMDYSLMTIAQEEVIFLCENCHQVFGNKGAYTIHRKKVHQRCPLCKALFNSIEAMHEHTKKTCSKRMLPARVDVVLMETDKKIRPLLPKSFLDVLATATRKKSYNSTARKSSSAKTQKSNITTSRDSTSKNKKSSKDKRRTLGLTDIFPLALEESTDQSNLLKAKNSIRALSNLNNQRLMTEHSSLIGEPMSDQESEEIETSSLNENVTKTEEPTENDTDILPLTHDNVTEIDKSRIYERVEPYFSEDNSTETYNSNHTIKISDVMSLNKDYIAQDSLKMTENVCLPLDNDNHVETSSNSNSKTSSEVDNLSDICLSAKACTPIQEMEDLELSDVESMHIDEDDEDLEMKNSTLSPEESALSLAATVEDVGILEMDEALYIQKLLHPTPTKKHVGDAVYPKDFVAVNIINKSITVQNLGSILANNEIVPVQFKYQQGRRVETRITDYVKKTHENRFYDFSRKGTITMENYKQMHSMRTGALCTLTDWGRPTNLQGATTSKASEKSRPAKRPYNKKKCVPVKNTTTNPLNSTSESITPFSGQSLEQPPARHELAADLSELLMEILPSNQSESNHLLKPELAVQHATITPTIETQTKVNDEIVIIDDTPGVDSNPGISVTQSCKLVLNEGHHNVENRPTRSYLPTIKILTPQAINNKTVVKDLTEHMRAEVVPKPANVLPVSNKNVIAELRDVGQAHIKKMPTILKVNPMLADGPKPANVLPVIDKDVIAKLERMKKKPDSLKVNPIIINGCGIDILATLPKSVSSNRKTCSELELLTAARPNLDEIAQSSNRSFNVTLPSYVEKGLKNPTTLKFAALGNEAATMIPSPPKKKKTKKAQSSAILPTMVPESIEALDRLQTQVRQRLSKHAKKEKKKMWKEQQLTAPVVLSEPTTSACSSIRMQNPRTGTEADTVIEAMRATFSVDRTGPPINNVPNVQTLMIHPSTKLINITRLVKY